MKPRTWLGIVLCVLLVAGSYVALDQTVFDRNSKQAGGQGGSGGQGKTSDLSEHDYDEGKDEPSRTRVHLDNSGPSITVSVRTAAKPWAKRLDVHLNGRRSMLQHGTRHVQGHCAPKVTTRPDSLITRLSYPRTCVKNNKVARVRVAVDGGEPISATARKKKTPNVLMLMVDDMRTDELKYMPNVQRLIADQGVTFTNGFAPLPLCCPARASVFTGQYPHNHGVWSQQPPWGFSSMHDKSTFPVWMNRRGYRMSYLGKYLNRFGRDPAPGRETGKSFHYVPPGWDQFRASVDGLKPGHPFFGGTHQYFNTTLTKTGKGFLSLKGKYQSKAYAQLEQASLRKEAREKDPFFHFVSFSAPHVGTPVESDDPKDLLSPARPKRVWGMFDDEITEAPGAHWHDPDRSDKPNEMRKVINKDLKEQMLALSRQRAESVHLVDKAVGRIMRTLKRTGQLDNTIVAFTSDNGYFLGEQGKPEGKTMPYEPSLRVPVIMRGPGIPEGEVRTDPYLSIDFAPTFADLADARMTSSVDGRSMLDVARLGDESAGESWDRMVVTETSPTRSVITALSHEDPIGLQTKKLLRGKVSGLRTHQYLYTEWKAEPWDWEPGIQVELYDVLADPDQYDNLAQDPKHKAVVARLHKVLERGRKCAGDQCRVPLPKSLR